MSIAGRCMAASTASGMLVGPGMQRNSRPLATVMPVLLPGENLASSTSIARATGLRQEDRDRPRRPPWQTPRDQAQGDLAAPLHLGPTGHVRSGPWCPSSTGAA